MVIYRGALNAPGKDLVLSTWVTIINELGIDPRYKPILRYNSRETKFPTNFSLLFGPGNMDFLCLTRNKPISLPKKG